MGWIYVVTTKKAMAPHSSTLAWKILWMEEPGRLHGVHGVLKSRTRLSDFTFIGHKIIVHLRIDEISDLI